jgi:hypothetical protein
MLFIFRHFLLFIFFTIYLITVDTRSIHEDTINRLIKDPFDQNDQNLFTTLANYRHRFERSMNFKKLRWAIGSLNNEAICDACDLLVPEVILSLQSIIYQKDTYFRCEY